MNSNDALLNEIISMKEKLHDMYIQHYFQTELFSPIWWALIALLTIPLIIWWRILDKRRVLEICVFGLLVNIASSFLDVILSDYMMWDYPVRVLPQLSLLLPVDYVIAPVVGMALYQKLPAWGKFLLGSTIASAFMSFVCEPFAVRIGMYHLFTWKYAYSFPIYVAMYALAKFTTQKFASIEKKKTGIPKNH